MIAPVRVGVVGTSWWSDAMYLPALADHPDVELTAVCGRRPESTESFARRWGVAGWFTDPHAMLSACELDAVVVATANDSHHPVVMAALERGTHILCEKPLALDEAQAVEMARAARAAEAITMVPFTYRWMPMMQWMKRLIDDGAVGRPLQLNFRYFSGYGLDGEYLWRFDPAVAGSGIIGDLGSHLIHLARWLIGDEEVAVSATSARLVERAARPDGVAYQPLEDTAVLTIRYRSGARGVLHATAAAWEGEHEIAQLHGFDVHGDGGTLHGQSDWHTVQEVRGSRRGEAGPPSLLPIPDDLWGDLRRTPVPDTYRDVFRTTDAMTRGWIDAIVEGRTIEPDFDEGLAVQRVIDAAVASAALGGAEVAIGGASSAEGPGGR